MSCFIFFYYVVHHHCRFCVRTGSERGITARSLSEPAVRGASLPVLCQNRQWWCTLLTPARRPFCRHLPLPLLFLSSSSPLPLPLLSSSAAAAMEQRPHPADAIRARHKAKTLQERLTAVKNLYPRQLESRHRWGLNSFGWEESVDRMSQIISECHSHRWPVFLRAHRFRARHRRGCHPRLPCRPCGAGAASAATASAASHQHLQRWRWWDRLGGTDGRGGGVVEN